MSLVATGNDIPKTGAPRRIGLFAGWGRYPVLIAETLRAQGCEVYCLGVPNHADPRLAEICTDFRWCGMAKFGRACRYMRRHGVERGDYWEGDRIKGGGIHTIIRTFQGPERKPVGEFEAVVAPTMGGIGKVE